MVNVYNSGGPLKMTRSKKRWKKSNIMGEAPGKVHKNQSQCPVVGLGALGAKRSAI